MAIAVGVAAVLFIVKRPPQKISPFNHERHQVRHMDNIAYDSQELH